MRTRGRLFWKYILHLVTLVSAALLISGLTEAYFSHKENLARLSLLQQEKAVAAADKINSYITSLERLLQWTTLPQSPAGDDTLQLRRFQYLKLLRQAAAISEVRFLDENGFEQLLVSRLSTDVIGSEKDFSTTPTFVEALEKHTYFSPVYFLKETEPHILVALSHVFGATGVTVAQVNLKFIWEVISKIQFGHSGHAYVVDDQGRLIAHPDLSLVLRKKDMSDLPQVRRALSGSAPADAGIADEAQTIDLGGAPVLSAFAATERLGWTVFVEQPRDEAFLPLYKSLERTGLLFLVALVIAVLASVLLARSMATPIHAIRMGAEKIGGGALDHRIEVRTADELEDLSRQFNGMAEQLQRSYADLERKVEERTRDLEVANRHKSEFLANMSHELRTPLNAVIGFSEVLKEGMFGELNEKQTEYVNDIFESGHHLLSLINDILDLSKVEAGQMELEPSTFELGTALQNAITLVKERAARHGIALSTNIGENIGAVTADQRKIKQVTVNLLSNAVKFTPDGGSIALQAVRRRDAIEVSVADTGIGISPENQEMVFEAFQQVSGDSAQSSEGTGLGLSLAKRFVELHGGRIWLTSEPGKGSTFTYTIPEQT